MPVSTFSSWAIEKSLGLADQVVHVAADGTLTRERVSRTLYPLAPCPPEALAAVDAPTLARLRVLQTPAERMPPTTSAETQAVAAQATASCPVHVDGFVSPEWLVPPGVRWILTYYADGSAPSPSGIVDSAGRSMTGPSSADQVRGRLDSSALRELDGLVGGLHDERSTPRSGSASCAFVQVTHVGSRGARRQGQPQIVCDRDGASADLRALLHFIDAALVPLAPMTAPTR